MTTLLNWKEVKVKRTLPVRLTVTGNADTTLTAHYYWMPTTGNTAEAEWDRKDGVELGFDPALIQAPPAQNHLGFSAFVLPIVRSETQLHVTFQVRQGNTILLEHGYPLQVNDPNIPIRLNDGITLTL